MKIMTPKIFHGEKKKGRFTKETVFFEDEVTMENITNFYKDKSITHATVLSKTASLYDPLGFIAPLKIAAIHSVLDIKRAPQAKYH